MTLVLKLPTTKRVLTPKTKWGLENQGSMDKRDDVI